MIAAVDCHYRRDFAVAGGILFHNWNSPNAELEFRVVLEHVKPYEPGSFYRRELPCLVKLLDQVKDRFDVVLIDGYVWLNAEESPGLGVHLHRALGMRVPVIGVAKSPYRSASHARRIFRGSSLRPLYVTSVGMDPLEAAGNIESMHGAYRIPTLLKRVDRLCRSQLERSTLKSLAQPDRIVRI